MRVLQLIDSLNVGGAERLAITLANELSDKIEGSYLCSTRNEGPMKESISNPVKYLYLNKKHTLDIYAIIRLIAFLKKEKIAVIHAHSTSFFLASIVKITLPSLKLIWHDHYGDSENLKHRKFRTLKLFSKNFNVIISVNEQLREWAVQNLKCNKVFFIKNFASIPKKDKTAFKIVREKDLNLVCVANIRKQKDHLTLIRAFQIAYQKFPSIALHLIGDYNKESPYYLSLCQYIEENEIKHIHFYGAQTGISEVLKEFDIAILSSTSEGLPIALLEYGLAALPVVCTKVGQCEEVLGNRGILVPPSNPIELAEALIKYLSGTNLRLENSTQFHKHILNNYSAQAVLPTILKIYQN